MHKPIAEPLDDLLAMAEIFALTAMEKWGNVPPTFMAQSAAGVLCLTPETMQDERAKNAFGHVAQLICIAHSVSGAVMILESWLSTASTDGSADLTVPPSQSPNRQELVVLVGESRSGNRHKLLPILRATGGQFLKFGTYAGPPADNLSGRFARLLPPRTPTREEREHASLILAGLGIKFSGGDHRRDPFAN